METSYVPLILACIAGIVWFVRVEGRVNASADKITKLELHVADDQKHFNSKAFDEFKIRMEEKFHTLGEQVKEVKVYCEEIDGKLDTLKDDLKV